MMSGKAVLFRLSPEGQNVLEGLVPGGGSFQAFVVNEDDVGPWILFDSRQGEQADSRFPVMKLKWDYIATAAFEYQPPVQAERERMSF